MGTKQFGSPRVGGKLFNTPVSLDATTNTSTTVSFAVGISDVWNTHFVWTDDSTTFAVTITLWGSNIADADPDDDTDWVQLGSTHGYDGLPGGNPSGGAGKDMTDIGVSGALWYRWKFACTAGSGTITGYMIKKQRK